MTNFLLNLYGTKYSKESSLAETCNGFVPVETTAAKRLVRPASDQKDQTGERSRRGDSNPSINP